jgi:tRNA A-37 threonylcarbamoyl transferase component Bud32
MTAEEIVKFRDGELIGECLADYADLPLREIPWDTIKRRPDPRYRLVKASHTRRVVSFSFRNKTGVEEIVFAKRCRVRGLRKRIAQLFISSKAKREWRIARLVLAHGVPTALPLLYAESRRGLWLTESYIVTRGLAGFVSAFHRLKEIPYAAQKKLLKCLGEFIRAQHDAGFYHDDCSMQHIFVKVDSGKNDAPQFSIIDLDNAKWLHYVSLYRRLKNLFQLLRSFPEGEFRERGKVVLFNAYFSSAKDQRRKRRLICFMRFIAWLKRADSPLRLRSH